MYLVNIDEVGYLMDGKTKYLNKKISNYSTGNECITDILDFTIHGKTYSERKNCLREISIAYSNTEYSDLSYSELHSITDYFRKNGKRYGLLEEFNENGII